MYATGALPSYLGQERAVVLWELDLRNVEELELPLFGRQPGHLMCALPLSSRTGVTAMAITVPCSPLLEQQELSSPSRAWGRRQGSPTALVP